MVRWSGIKLLLPWVAARGFGTALAGAFLRVLSRCLSSVLFLRRKVGAGVSLAAFAGLQGAPLAHAALILC